MKINRKLYTISSDFGSSGGKIFLGTFDDGKIQMEEINRFKLEVVQIRQHYYTDVVYMWSELLKGIKKIIDQGIKPSSLGIDTWGVDYAYLDANGELLAIPINYRSERTINTANSLKKQGITAESLYSTTGIIEMPYNTLFQVYEDVKSRKEIVNHAKHFLFIADLFTYWLTKVISTEYTIASTSQMMNIHNKVWDTELLEKIGFPKEILPDIKDTGSIKGMLSPEWCKYFDCEEFPIFASSSHDTASAVLATPLDDKNSVFVSSGSWSLMGMEIDNPIINKEALEAKLTNEIGFDKSIRFLKSINGLWLLQLLQRQWNISFAEIMDMATKSIHKGLEIDITDERFYGVDNVEQSIVEYCKLHGKPVPESRGETASAVYNGLATAHELCLRELSKVTNTPIHNIHIVGGGSKDILFCELIAKKTKCRTVLGPVEGAAIGNALTQLIGLGALKDRSDARKCVKNSFDIQIVSNK